MLDEVAAVNHDEEGVQDEGSGDTTSVVVKMKLNTFCTDSDLRERIRSLVLGANRLVAEAYAFANFHMLRLLEQGLDLPKIDRSFYYRCLLAVAVSKVRKNTLDAEFIASIDAFDALRAAGTQKVDIGRWNPLVASLSITMATMATNHLVLSNLDDRILRYVKWRYPALKGVWRKITHVAVTPKASLADVFRCRIGAPLHVQAKNADASSVARELREALGFTSVKRFASVAHRTIALYHRIRKETAAAMMEQEKAGTRCVRFRPFDLLPMKGGFTVSYIPISTMTFMSLIKSHEGFKGDGRDQDHDKMWRKYFDVRAAETRTRKFGGSFVTDGCGVSVLIAKKSLLHCPDKAPRRSAVLNAVVRGASVVGVDPGFSEVITATVRDGDGTKHVLSYSSSRYYEEAGFKCSKRRTDRWNRDTKSMLDALPSSRSAVNIRGMEDFLRVYLSVLTPVLRHRAEKGYRNMRFMRYTKRQRSIEAVCDMLAPPGRETVVGFGDWSGGHKSPISRRTCGPIEEIKHRLQRRAGVWFFHVDEHLTSQTCSCCRQRLVNMRASAVTKAKDGTKKEAQRVKVHSVLHCKSSDGNGSDRCGVTWNRDVNASVNILNLAFGMIHGEARPAQLCRAFPTKNNDPPRGAVGRPVCTPRAPGR